MGSVLRSETCHYCGDKAASEDHIVPRARLPKPLSQLPYWFRSMDVLPACNDCNWMKSHYRSDCVCDHCTWAWKTAIACGWMKDDYETIPVVKVVRSPG